MNDVKVTIRKVGKKKNFTIIYKDNQKELHEIQVFKENFLNTLGYFSKKRNEIYFQDIIYIEENISFELFNNFISSIETSEISLNDYNYEQYSYLSRKYEYDDLRREIDEFIENRPDIKSTINDLLISQKINSIDYTKETIITKNLDICIKSGLLNKLPIEILDRILTSPNRQIKDHHLLFDFVISIIKDKLNEPTDQPKHSKIEYFTILPSCLDYCEMNSSEIEELLELENKIDLFSPKNSTKKLKSLISNEDEMNRKFSELDSKFNEMGKKISCLEESQIAQGGTSSKKFDELQERLSKIERCSEISEETENKLRKDVDDQKTKQNSNEETIQFLKNKIKELEDKLTSIELMNKEEKKEIEKFPNEINCQDGIFEYFFKKNNSNPALNGLIEITGNSNNDSRDKLLPNIIDSKWSNDYWVSKNEPNSYIKIDFKNSLVKIDRYRIRSGCRTGIYYFKSWVLSGLTEDNQEIVLDEVNNSPDVTDNHQETTKTTQIQKYVHSIKITMKGKRTDTFSTDYYYMNLYNVELFGTIVIK